MDFKVNDFTTIKDFVRTGSFEHFIKYGTSYKYERFTGKMGNDKVKGFICLADDAIYRLEKM